MTLRVLDLFCGAGGAAKGYHDGFTAAGFDVDITGVDIEPQPNYPYHFVQTDALEYVDWWLPLRSYRPPWDFIHASPPCQAFTAAQVIHGNEHPDLLTPTRERLREVGVPWVIENVPGAPMRRDVVLCGSAFGERRLRRHRWFELWDPTRYALVPPCNHGPVTVSVFGHGGHVYNGVAEWREVMGIDWMNRDELAQAIPPAYTAFLAEQIAPALMERAA